MMMIDNEIAAAALLMMTSVPAATIDLMVMIDRWGLDGNDVSSLHLGPSKSLLEPRDLGRVVANSTGCYFGSDFGCKSVYRYMDYDAGLYRPFVLLDNTRCMCTDTEFDWPDCCIGRHTPNSQKAPLAENTCKVLHQQNTAGSRSFLSSSLL